jgi:3-oxoacyl-[acyl-carrier protein] reductase
MNKILEGKNAIVTGARRGIGRAIVESFAANGANIWSFARAYDETFESDMISLSEKYRVWIKPVYAELSDESTIKKSVQLIIKEKLPIDVLVNNAGITYNSLFQMTPMEILKEQFTVNFFAPYLLTQLVTRVMLKNGSGSIINISSALAIDSHSGRSAYGSAKAALICTTKIIAKELGYKGIRANVIAPGIIDTEMTNESTSEQVVFHSLEETMLKRIGRPNNIADAAVFLASDNSSYITGQVLRVDGGM